MKIAICIPVYSDTTAQFTAALGKMLITTLGADVRIDGRPVKLELELFMARGSDLAENRRTLVQSALNWGATYILFADADHAFPRDALLRLLAHNAPVVGCNYLTRDPPYQPTATGLDHGPMFTTKASPATERVAALGLGFVLLKAQIFNVLKQPWFRFEVADDGTRTSEDTYLFRKIGEAGIQVHLDHALSWHVGHVGERIITNEDAGRSNADTVLSASGP